MKEVLAASRPFSWVNTAYPFAAGVLVATGGTIDATLVVGTLFFLVPYNLLMYGVNDVFDYASDLRNPRKGGIEGGLVAPERARAVHRRILVACVVSTVPYCAPWPDWKIAVVPGLSVRLSANGSSAPTSTRVVKLVSKMFSVPTFETRTVSGDVVHLSVI